jgi:hypothetical protein
MGSVYHVLCDFYYVHGVIYHVQKALTMSMGFLPVWGDIYYVQAVFYFLTFPKYW